MAFISLVFMFIFLCILFVGFCGLIFLLIGIIKKAKSRKSGKKSKSSTVLIVLGSVLIFPVIAIFVIGIGGSLHTNIKNRELIGYQIRKGTTEDVERLLKKGISPNV